MQANAATNQNVPTESKRICCSCKELRTSAELSECPTCGKLFCGFRISNCKATCACDQNRADVLAGVEALLSKREAAGPVSNELPADFDIAKADEVLANLDALLAKRGITPATA